MMVQAGQQLPCGKVALLYRQNTNISKVFIRTKVKNIGILNVRLL